MGNYIGHSSFLSGANHWPRLVELLERHAIDCVFDVGANVGQYARALRKNGYDGRIVSFEPLTSAHAELTRSAANEGTWIVAARTAVGASAGETRINISPESDMSSILPLDVKARERLASTRSTETETVPVTTLSDALEAHAGSSAKIFVKSDTQGYENEVLSGIGDSWSRITGIQLELSLQPIYEGQPDHLPLLDRLAAQGLRPHLVIPGYWSRHYGRMLEYDVVCFRD
ncbi:MAG: methyltransferase, FkbM family domain protein [Alphaproteobacteria bacterium]|nr:methyltransferase, FkbM family domain protein [Alphaproteobacteria bacterium]